MQQPKAPVMTLPGEPPDDPSTPTRPEEGAPDTDAPDRRVSDITVHQITVDVSRHPEHSFDTFYRTHRPGVAKALAFALGDADLAADATDEAFVRAYERWDKVRGLDRPEAWVYRVATNWATSILRRRRHHHRLYEPDAEAPGVVDPAVHRSLAALDVKHRSVVVCRHLLGWSVADTAAALGIREGTVKSRLHRATQALQAALHHLDPHHLDPTEQQR